MENIKLEPEDDTSILEHQTSDMVTSVNLMDHIFKVDIEENELEPVMLKTVAAQTKKRRKKERSVNYSNAEIQLLRYLVDKYAFIIEDKKTDSATNKDKKNVWIKIQNSFNSRGVSSIYRSWKTLKLKYKALQKSKKMESAQERQEMYRNGGTPSTVTDIIDLDEDSMALSNCSDTTGTGQRHDSDAITIPIKVGTEVDPTSIVEVICNNHQQNEPENTSLDDIRIPDMNGTFVLGQTEEDHAYQKESKRKKCKPTTLRTKASNKSEISIKTSVKTKLKRLRLHLVQLELLNTRRKLQFMKEEHKLKITQMKEEHSFKMINLSKDEKRKQELHEVMLQNMKCAPDL